MAPAKSKEELYAAEQAKKAQNKLLLGFIAEQKVLMLLGLPFMFLGSITDFVFPDYIGRVADALRAGEWDLLDEIVIWWMACMFTSATCAVLRDVIFGMTSERIGTRIRQRLFESVIQKDVAFFDDNLTGDILSRLQSDT